MEFLILARWRLTLVPRLSWIVIAKKRKVFSGRTIGGNWFKGWTDTKPSCSSVADDLHSATEPHCVWNGWSGDQCEPLTEVELEASGRQIDVLFSLSFRASGPRASSTQNLATSTTTTMMMRTTTTMVTMTKTPMTTRTTPSKRSCWKSTSANTSSSRRHRCSRRRRRRGSDIATAKKKLLPSKLKPSALLMIIVRPTTSKMWVALNIEPSRWWTYLPYFQLLVHTDTVN